MQFPFTTLFWMLVAVAVLPAWGQDRTQLLDVVVTDSNGRAVSSLTANDFVISLDGRPQELVECSYVSTRREHQPSASPAPLFGIHQARRMVLLVDDLNLSVEGAGPLRQALRHYVDEQMQDGDEAVVVRTSAGMGSEQRFTSDPRSLRTVIDRLQSRRFTDPGAADSLFSVGTLDILQLVFDGLRGVPGRKSVILFTEAKTVSSPVVLDSLIEKANRAFVVFYAIDARGATTTFKEIRPPADAPLAIYQPPLPASVFMANPPSEAPGSMLEALAKATGGMALDRGDVASQFARVFEDQQGYYLIRYHRDFAIFRPVTGDRLVEHVNVKVARDGLHARARDGFPPTSDWVLDAPTTTAETLLQALRSPFSAGEIHLSLDALFFHTVKEGPLLKLRLHIDARDVTFLKTLDGLYQYGIDAGIMTLGTNGAPAVHAHTQLSGVPMTEDQHQDALRRGLTYEVGLPVEPPGFYQVRIAVSDQMSDRLGAANQFVYVPDVAKGQLILSAVTLVGALDGDPKSLRFKPGEPLAVTYEIYNLTRGPDNSSELDLRIRLVREFKEVIAAGPTLIHFGPNADPEHRSVTSRIVPDSNLEPGTYTLHLTVTDKLAKPPPRAATREIHFQIPNP